MSKKNRNEEVQDPQDEAMQRRLEEAAYYRWLNRGCPPDEELSNWLEAEKEILQTAQ